MCTYNGASYIKEQLDSIISQTYPVYELIIQDDGSTDGTLQIIQEYQERYSFVQVYQNKEKKGINRNFFSAMYLAKGDYIAISDQDDIWEKDKLKIQMASIGEALLSSGFSKPFATGDSIKIHFDSRLPNCTLERMIYVGVTPGHTLLIHKSLLGKIPNLEKWIDCCTYDKLLQMVAAAYERVQFCDAILVHNRRHIKAATYGPAEDYQRNICNVFRTISRTVGLYRELEPHIQKYFKTIYLFLKEIDAHTVSLQNARCLAQCHSHSSVFWKIRLVYYCVKFRDRIFYVKEQNRLLSMMRALFFPVSCSDYFRYMSSKYRKL